MSSRHREKSRSRPRDRDRDRERDRDRDRDRDRERHRSKRDRSRHRSRDKDRKSKDRKRSKDRRTRSRSKDRNKSKERYHRDGTIALLDQMVGTTTTSTARTPAASLAGRVAQAALLAAHVAQKVDKPSHMPEPIYEDNPDETPEERKLRRRKSRWAGSEHDKTFIPGMPTILPPTLTKEQEEQYLLQLQIEEVSRKLRSGDLGIPANPEERSPSPEPIYSSDGKRLNMREYRTRRKLEETRHSLVQSLLVINPDFKPPSDYKPPIIRVHDKVMIPQEQHPDLNFVGLLIGPRGNTLKSMEKETGAKIIIRGKGSVKEGKVGRKDGQPLPGEDEPLHAYITATNPECVKKAVDKIKEVIRQGVEVPEGQNDLRRMQLRELAQLNGTLREGDARGRCSNCGASDHKSWMCPDKPNVTNTIVCSSCGGAGHIAGDCRSKRPGQGGPPPAAARAKIDEEYLSLMAELGEGPPPDAQPKQNNHQQRRNQGNPFGGGDRGPMKAIAMTPHMLPPSLPPPPPPIWIQGPAPTPLGQPPPPGATSVPPPNINSQIPPLMAPPGFNPNQMMSMMGRHPPSIHMGMGNSNIGPNMGPNMGANMGPNMGQNIGQNIGLPSTNMGPPGTNMVPPGTNMGPPGTNMGNMSNNMLPLMGPPGINNMGPPGMGQDNQNEKRFSMGPPGMGPPGMGPPGMGPPGMGVPPPGMNWRAPFPPPPPPTHPPHLNRTSHPPWGPAPPPPPPPPS